MGYDMYLRGEIEGEAEAVAAAREAYQRAVARRDALTKDGQGPRWLTEEEESLPEEERAKISNANMEECTRLEKEGVDFWDARNRAGSVKPSQEWLEAQQEVMAASEVIDDARKSYFRLNVFGMSRCCEIMDDLDMLKPGLRDIPWPRLKDFITQVDGSKIDALQEFYDEVSYDLPSIKLTRSDLVDAVQGAEELQAQYEIADDLIDATLADYLAYRDAIEHKLAAHQENLRGIGGNKFDSNDGWIVTPEECEGALSIWRDQLSDGTRDKVLEENPWFAGWIEFLENGVRTGGFTVH